MELETFNIQQRNSTSGSSLQSGTPSKLSNVQPSDKIRQRNLFEEIDSGTNAGSQGPGMHVPRAVPCKPSGISVLGLMHFMGHSSLKCTEIIGTKKLQVI